MSKPDDGRTYLAGCRPWDRGRMEAAKNCPVCHGGQLTILTYCLWCNRFGMDKLVAAGAASYPGQFGQIRIEYMTADEMEAKAAALEKAAADMNEEAAAKTRAEARMYRDEARRRPHPVKPTTYTPDPDGLKGGTGR